MNIFKKEKLDNVEEQSWEEKYIEWQKEFVNGDQFSYFNEFVGGKSSQDKKYYWQQHKVYNIIYTYVKKWELQGYTNIYGKGGVVDQLIPYQERYNEIMNLIDGIIERIAYPTLAVEDGSVDVDELSEEGLCPGKILVYRQGSRTPSIVGLNETDGDLLNTLYNTTERIKKEILEIVENVQLIKEPIEKEKEGV